MGVEVGAIQAPIVPIFEPPIGKSTIENFLDRFLEKFRKTFLKNTLDSTLENAFKIAPKSVVLVGGANVDIVGQAQHPLLMGDSTPGKVTVTRGGVARNLAENLARLGLATQLYSAVGQDAWGDRLCAETQTSGVGVDGIYRSPTLPTAQYLSLVQPDGSLCLALNDMRVLAELSPTRLRQLGFELATGSKNGADSSHAPGATVAANQSKSRVHAWVLDCNLQPDTLAWLFAQAQSCPPDWLVVDAVSAAKCHKVLAHLAQIQVLKLNRLEAKALTGLAVDSLAEAQRAAHWCWQRGVRHTVLSLGEQGVCWVDATGQVGHLAAPKVQIANTNGAGDALLAGVIYGQLAGFLWPQSVQWGMSCAALTLAGPTANTPYLTAQAVTAAILQQERNENQPHDT